LTRCSFEDRDDVSSELRLLFVVDFFLFEKRETLSFDFDVVLFLVKFAKISRSARIERSLFFLFTFLLFLVFLRSPYIVDLSTETEGGVGQLTLKSSNMRRGRRTSRSSTATISPSRARLRSFEPVKSSRVSFRPSERRLE
jgi:hypothetical protein